MNREKPSYIPLFPDSYLADTTHLSTEQHGAYLLLLMAAWRSNDCSLAHDQHRLALLAGIPLARWRKLGPTIMEMWICEGGRCWQKRLRREWEYVQSKRGQARNAVASREHRKALNRSSPDASDDVSGDEHLGEGGGGGSKNPFQEEETSGGKDTVGQVRGRAAFAVIDGGAR